MTGPLHVLISSVLYTKRLKPLMGNLFHQAIAWELSKEICGTGLRAFFLFTL